jgi:hypothetical protein
VNSRHALGLSVLRAARGSRYETVNSNFKIADYSARLPNRLVLPSPSHLRPFGRLGAITPAPSFFFLRAALGAHYKTISSNLERLDILSASEAATVGPITSARSARLGARLHHTRQAFVCAMSARS